MKRLWLRSLAFNIAMYGVTILTCVLLCWTLLLPRRMVARVAKFWQSQVAWCERHVGGIQTRIVGWEHVPEGACIIAAKHQSAWETFKLNILFDDPAIVLKKELLSIPFWGWFLKRSGMIPIDRARRGGALPGMAEAAHVAVTQGRKIVIFPQGTRVAVGVSRPYKQGIALLYQELNLPVIPMAINAGLFWPKDSFIKRPGTITIEFLPPIPAGIDGETMRLRLECELEAASDRLCANP